MKKEQPTIGQEKKVEELHWEIQKWKSHFQFLDDELTFIERLLGSYVFQPNTPNLFERLQEYKIQIQKIETTKKEVRDDISTHENTLGGMLECMDSTCDLAYYRKHDKLKKEVDTCFTEFQELKSKIFNYAGGILKKRKP
jgi:chromosome segregation ATPase